MMEVEIWKLVIPWLDSQELGNLAGTCRAMAVIARSLTGCRVGDVTQGQEIMPVPIVNDADDCRYPNFCYIPFCQRFSSSKHSSRTKWGFLESRGKLAEAEFAGAMTMDSMFLGVGCKCLGLCTTSENLPPVEDDGQYTSEQSKKKRRTLSVCHCGRLVGGQTAYDQVSRLRLLTNCEKVQSTDADVYDTQMVPGCSLGRTIREAEDTLFDELENMMDVTGDLSDQEQAAGPSSLLECGPACSCCTDCKYRVSQHGVSVNLKVVRSRNKGWSLCARQQIKQGAFVCEYAGELITNKEARQRHMVYDRLRKSKDWQGSALLVLKEHLPSGRASVRVNVDATRIGNVARFINHSCDGGNLLPCIIRLAGRPIPKLGLFARRSISDGEELTYSYGAGGGVSEDKMSCFCGTSACRGTLPSDMS